MTETSVLKKQNIQLQRKVTKLEKQLLGVKNNEIHLMKQLSFSEKKYNKFVWEIARKSSKKKVN